VTAPAITVESRVTACARRRCDGRAREISLDQARTLATITLLGIGLTILTVTSRPLAPWKVVRDSG
jgi:hypothetical protein